MRVIWSLEAQLDRADIWNNIANDNPRAAARIDELFSDAAARLSDHPKLGKPGKISGTRELIPLQFRTPDDNFRGESIRGCLKFFLACRVLDDR